MQLDTLEVSKSNISVAVLEEVTLAFYETGTLIDGIGLYVCVINAFGYGLVLVC